MNKTLVSTILTSALLAGISVPTYAQQQYSTLTTSAASQSKVNLESSSHLNPSERGKLVSYEKVAELSTKQIHQLNPETNIRSLLAYGVTLYSVSYTSLYDGEPVVLSGLVSIPSGKTKPSFLQYHHGTMLPVPAPEGEGSNDAPSLYRGKKAQPQAGFDEVRMMVLTFASKGYVVSAPDYAGYNLSKNLDHPYNFGPQLAEYSVDMLKATQELTKRLSIKTDNKVFLTGWSEGAGAALATQKKIEQDSPQTFNLVATSALAGPYDIPSMIESSVGEAMESPSEETESVSENIGIYNWTLYTLLKFNHINRPYSDVWNYKVENSLDALMPPSDKISEIFNPVFLERLLSGQDLELLYAIQNSSLINGWKPKAKIMFHSGKNDEIVPHFNSLNAYNTFKKLGSDVTLYEYEGDHYTPALDYLTTTIKEFGKLSRRK
ncbi:alpha/beta hydrolase family protein [Paenibacillus sp. Z6-24]